MIVDACGLTLVFFKIINSNTNLNLKVANMNLCTCSERIVAFFFLLLINPAIL